jgi:regulator of sigma E protease
MTYCQPFTPAAVGQIQPGSSAEQGGIRPGDLILKIDGATVHRFEDIQQAVRLNPGVPITIVVRRGGEGEDAACDAEAHQADRPLWEPLRDRSTRHRPTGVG